MGKLKTFILVIGVAGLCNSTVMAFRNNPKRSNTVQASFAGFRDRAPKAGAETSSRFIEEIDLTDEQKEELREQKHNRGKERIKLNSNLRLKQKDLRYELSRKELDEGKIDNLVEEISDLQKKILEHRVESLKNFKSILTDEQWEKLKDKRMEHLKDRNRMPRKDKHPKRK